MLFIEEICIGVLEEALNLGKKSMAATLPKQGSVNRAMVDEEEPEIQSIVEEK